MTRIGSNPAKKKKTAYRPAEVTVATVTFIPSLEGYFSHRLETLKLTLDSARAHTDRPINTLVFDNGCCAEVREYLQEELSRGGIDYLIHSRRNLGVIGAFKILFQAAPSEIVAYSDDDVFYYPGWLPAHLEILKAFPDVGMVSGAPVGTYTTEANTSIKDFLARAQDGVQASEVPRVLAWEEDWAKSTGRDVEEHLEWAAENPNFLLEHQKTQAIGFAKHFQFLTTKSVMNEVLPSAWSGELMHGLLKLDRAVDQGGYLRLSTPTRYSRHIGNRVSPKMAREAKGFSLAAAEAPASRKQRHWLLKIPGAGRLLNKVYDWLFDVLNDIK